jgi:hypothetical protein
VVPLLLLSEQAAITGRTSATASVRGERRRIGDIRVRKVREWVRVFIG